MFVFYITIVLVVTLMRMPEQWEWEGNQTAHGLEGPWNEELSPDLLDQSNSVVLPKAMYVRAHFQRWGSDQKISH